MIIQSRQRVYASARSMIQDQTGIESLQAVALIAVGSLLLISLTRVAHHTSKVANQGMDSLWNGSSETSAGGGAQPQPMPNPTVNPPIPAVPPSLPGQFLKPLIHPQPGTGGESLVGESRSTQQPNSSSHNEPSKQESKPSSDDEIRNKFREVSRELAESINESSTSRHVGELQERQDELLQELQGRSVASSDAGVIVLRDAVISDLKEGIITSRDALKALSQLRREAPFPNSFTVSSAIQAGFAPIEVELGKSLHRFDRALLQMDQIEAHYGKLITELPDELVFKYSHDRFDRIHGGYFLRKGELDGGLQEITEDFGRGGKEWNDWFSTQDNPANNWTMDGQGRDGQAIKLWKDANGELLQGGGNAIKSTTGWIGYGAAQFSGKSLEERVRWAQLAAVPGQIIDSFGGRPQKVTSTVGTPSRPGAAISSKNTGDRSPAPRPSLPKPSASTSAPKPSTSQPASKPSAPKPPTPPSQGGAPPSGGGRSKPPQMPSAERGSVKPLLKAVPQTGSAGNRKTSAAQQSRTGSNGARGPKPLPPLTPKQKNMKEQLLKEHSQDGPPLDPIVADHAVRGTVAKPKHGGDLELVGGGRREVSVFSGKFERDALGGKLIEKASQQGVKEIYVQIKSQDARPDGLIRMLAGKDGLRRGLADDLGGKRVKFFGPKGNLWWSGEFR